MTDIFVAPAHSVRGEVEVPGDKSISHRSLLLSLLSEDPVEIHGLANSADVNSTIKAIEQLGAKVERSEDVPTDVRVTGVGMRGLKSSGATIDAGNAGTLARLLSGILSGQEGTATIVGDASLSGRPMQRIITPLSAMGATLEPSETGTLPMKITGAESLASVIYDMPVASAQVQSAVLLAGLYASGPVTVNEPAVVRDHTERMLSGAGVKIVRKGRTVTIHPPEKLQLSDIEIPADPSGVAPLMVAATVLPESFLRFPNVCINPGRTGFFDLMEKMGARMTQLSRRHVSGEPVADIEVQSSSVGSIRIEFEDYIPRAIDEVPILALLSFFVKAQTFIRGAGELRVKESDRIEATVTALKAIGIPADEISDGLVIGGSSRRPEGGIVNARGDHRIAMLGGIAGLISAKGVTVENAECVDVSYPGFFDVLEAIAIR